MTTQVNVEKFANATDAVKQWLASAKSACKRALGFAKFVRDAKHKDGTAGTLDSIPEQLVTEAKAAILADYIAEFPTRTVLVRQSGTGEATTRKAAFVPKGFAVRVHSGEGEVFMEKVFNLKVAEALDADTSNMEPLKAKAYQLVKDRKSDRIRIYFDRLVSAAKKAEELEKDTAAEAAGDAVVNGAEESPTKRNFRKYIADTLAGMETRASKAKRAKDGTVPESAKAIAARVTAFAMKEYGYTK
jgi:hypothetical protein